MIVTDDEMKAAVSRIGQTPDGELLYRYCQKVLCAVVTNPDHHCALPAIEGRRRFASELMALMAEGMEASGRHAYATVIFSRAKPSAVSDRGGAGRRVTADTFVPGYDQPGQPRPGDD